NLPGVASYRVLGYTGNRSADVTRVEITLTPGATVNVADIAGGVQLKVAGAPGSASAQSAAIVPAASKTAEPAPKAMPPAPAVRAALAEMQPVLVRNIAVARGNDGVQVEISASAPVTPKLMKLTGPDRLVVDLPNAIPAVHQRPIMVNDSEI